jgi:hypothetical protein
VKIVPCVYKSIFCVFFNQIRACWNHICACRNHTACRNYTLRVIFTHIGANLHSACGKRILRVEINLVRIEITLMRFEITLVRVVIADLFFVIYKLVETKSSTARPHPNIYIFFIFMEILLPTSSYHNLLYFLSIFQKKEKNHFLEKENSEQILPSLNDHRTLGAGFKIPA